MQVDLLADSIEQLLAGCATPKAIRDIEGGGSRPRCGTRSRNPASAMRWSPRTRAAPGSA
jgi:hypothetical protein